MGLVIQLLGAPRVERDGEAMQAPRGHKAWGLLAYLLLASAPVSRRQLCALLFADAEDPLAAVRWNLSELRRLLSDPALLRGDPLELVLGPDDLVDVHAVVSGSWAEVESAGRVGQDLLESLTFGSCPSFEVWLETERRHMRGAWEAALREAALTELGRGQPSRAADLASQLVRMNPYDENFQALLVRALAASGDGVGAARQAAACRDLFRRELGVEPGPALMAAAATTTDRPTSNATAGPAGVQAQIEAGQAALGAGAIEAGVQCLRRAVAEADGLGDKALESRALVALGSALVHAARGTDEEGATALHQAVALSAGLQTNVLAHACRELGYVEFLRGRYDRVEPWLTRAESSAHDSSEGAWILAVRGSALSDVGRYGPALEALERSVVESSDEAQRSYALSMIGRLHLLRGDLEPAVEALDASTDLATRRNWTAFLPWPESFRAEVDLVRGDLDRAQARLDHAFALSCHVGDPCWEGVSARGLGLLRAQRGDIDEALSILTDARARSIRLPDAYLWVDAYILEAMCALAGEHAIPEGHAWAVELGEIAARTGMREFVVRALLHRASYGDTEAFSVATSAAEAVDNPLVRDLIVSSVIA